MITKAANLLTPEKCKYIIYEYKGNIPLEKKLKELITDRFSNQVSSKKLKINEIRH